MTPGEKGDFESGRACHLVTSRPMSIVVRSRPRPSLANDPTVYQAVWSELSTSGSVLKSAWIEGRWKISTDPRRTVGRSVVSASINPSDDSAACRSALVVLTGAGRRFASPKGSTRLVRVAMQMSSSVSPSAPEPNARIKPSPDKLHNGSPSGGLLNGPFSFCAGPND